MAEVKITITGDDAGATRVFRAVEESSKSAAGGVDTFGSVCSTAKSAAFQFLEGLMGWAAIQKVISILDAVKDKIIEVARESTLLTARVETLEIVMHKVGNTAGYSAAETDKYAEGVRKMGITTQESKDTIVKMIQANMDLSKATELARIAQDAAVIAKTNSSEAMSRLVNAIQTGQVEILRTMGINVNFENSYASLAKQLKKNVADLTEVEKTQARTNVVMEAGKTIAGSYEAAMGTVGKQMTSLPRYIEEAELQFGELFAPALSVIITGITDSLKDLGAWFTKMKESGRLDEWAGKIRDSVSNAWDVLKGFGSFIVNNWETIRQVATATWDAVKSVFVGFMDYVRGAPDDVNRLGYSIAEVKNFFLDWAASVEFMGKVAGNVFGFITSLVKDTITLIVNQFAPAGKILLGVMTLDLSLVKQGWNEYTANASKAITDVVSSFDTAKKNIGEAWDVMLKKMEHSTDKGMTSVKQAVKTAAADVVMQGPKLPENWLDPSKALEGIQKIFKSSKDAKGAVAEVATAFDAVGNQAANAGVRISAMWADNELNAGIASQRVIEYQVGITNSIKEWQRQLDDGNAKQALVMMRKEWEVLQDKISKIKIADMTPQQAAQALKPLNDELKILKEGMKVLATPHLDLSELRKDVKETEALFKDIGVLYQEPAAGYNKYAPSATPTSAFRNTGLTIEKADAVKDALDSIPDETNKEVIIEFQTKASPIMPFTEGMNKIKQMMTSLPTGSDYTVKFGQLANDWQRYAGGAAELKSYKFGSLNGLSYEGVKQQYQYEELGNNLWGQMVNMYNDFQKQGAGGGPSVSITGPINVTTNSSDGKGMGRDIQQQIADDIAFGRSPILSALQKKLVPA